MRPPETSLMRCVASGAHLSYRTSDKSHTRHTTRLRMILQEKVVRQTLQPDKSARRGWGQAAIVREGSFTR